MEQKRYFWLKLQHDFFASKRIKKLRTMAGGDTFVIIYLKMQLLSIKTNGVLTFTGLDKDFASELAIDLDESAENVAITLAYLKATGLIETSDDVNFLLPYARENTGAETAAAGRMREMRARRNLPEIEAGRNNVQTMCELRNGEIESEKELEIDSPPIIPPTGGDAGGSKDLVRERFNVFWGEYPRKTAKGDAEKVWMRLKPNEELFNTILGALRAIKETAQWKREGGRFVPLPATWLNQRRWEDGPNAVRGGSPNVQHDNIPSTYDIDDFYNKALERSYGGKKDG